MDKNERGSTLVISLLFLLFTLMASGHLMTQALQRHELLQIQRQTQGDYALGVQYSDLFMSTCTSLPTHDLQAQLRGIYPCLSVEELRTLIHAEYYLKEARSYFKNDFFFISSALVQSYRYSLNHKEDVDIQNQIYINEPYNYIPLTQTIQKGLTDYNKVKSKYTDTIQLLVIHTMSHIEDDLGLVKIKQSIQDLKLELDKPYQFLLCTQVMQQPKTGQGMRYSAEQVLFTLISYDINEDMDLSYEVENRYTPRNPRST